MLALLAAATVLVHGVVTIGPPTPARPAGHVVLEFTQASKIRMATTDARGRYSVSLSPGTWHVAATRGVRTTPARFIVRRVTAQRRDFALDSGLR